MNKIPKQIQNLIWYGQADIRQDSKTIITAVLTRGKFVDVRWLLQNYSQQEIIDAITKPLKGLWDRKSLNLWMKFFHLDISHKNFETAIFDVKNM